jgi:hypothetical protein
MICQCILRSGTVPEERRTACVRAVARAHVPTGPIDRARDGLSVAEEVAAAVFRPHAAVTAAKALALLAFLLRQLLDELDAARGLRENDNVSSFSVLLRLS